MKKFKLIFYPIYAIVTLLVIYYSIDILANMDTYKEKVPINMVFRDIPIYILSIYIFLSLLMITEIVIENLHIIRLKSKLEKAEKEVLSLKAKLYDQSSTPPAKRAIEEEDEDPDD